MQNITTDFLETLYRRANEFAITKWGKNPDIIAIDSDGTLTATFDGYERGDETYETIKAEDLTADLDAVTKERAEELNQERIKQEAHNLKMHEQRLKKEQRRQRYLKLKKEFE